MLIEKAWAKVHQSYSNIISGTPREVIRALTGCPTLSLKTDHPEFLSKFMAYVESKCILTSGSLSEGQGGISKATIDRLGLVPGHAYSILKIRDVTHPRLGKIKLLKLRNPWGNKEWK